MNERINELYEQSLVYEAAVDHLGIPYVAVKQNPEKFAEIIVKECIDQCDKHDPQPDQWIDPGEYTERRTVRNCIKSIKEHFGVKE